MRRVLLGVIASVFVSATGAQAQQGGSGASAGPNNSGNAEMNRQQNFKDFYDAVADSTRLTMRPVQAFPEDILQGLEVRDAKGLVIGKVEAVGKTFAIVRGAVGSVEVDFTSFAKNKKGLLINMPKSKIDALMARNHPPAP